MNQFQKSTWKKLKSFMLSLILQRLIGHIEIWLKKRINSFHSCKLHNFYHSNSYFTDLTFIHDGNTNKINIMRMQGQSLIKAFYLNNYGVKTKENYDLKCSILDTFYNYVPLTDQDCFQKSLALEPRGAEISQIKKKGKEKKDCIIC